MCLEPIKIIRETFALSYANVKEIYYVQNEWWLQLILKQWLPRTCNKSCLSIF